MNFSISGSKETTSLEDRFYNTVVLFGVINVVVIVLFNQMLGLSFYLNLFLVLLGSVYATLFYIGRIKRKGASNKFTLLFLVLTTLCVSWKYNDGYNGSTILYFFIATVSLVFLFKERIAIFVTIFITSVAIALSVIQYLYPQYITPYSSNEERLIDLLFSFITLLITLGYLVIAFKRNLYAERDIVEKQKIQIEAQFEELTNLHAVLTRVNNEVISQRDEISKKNAELEKTNSLLKEKKLSIQQQNKELQDLNAEKNKFFNIIAHDLKNPFQSIFGFSDLLINDIDTLDKERTLFFVKTIRSSAHNTYDLLENLLMWSRSQTGVIGFNPSPIYLKKMVFEIIRMLHGNSLAKNITVSCEMDDDIQINADRNMMSTVIRNLLSNAIKYTMRSGNVQIVASKSDYAITISVIDNGVGINEENIKNLFSISQKTSSLGTDNETGTGLGLILCKEFIEQHGGRISVESEYGKGSSFVLFLPHSFS